MTWQDLQPSEFYIIEDVYGFTIQMQTQMQSLLGGYSQVPRPLGKQQKSAVGDVMGAENRTEKAVTY